MMHDRELRLGGHKMRAARLYLPRISRHLVVLDLSSLVFLFNALSDKLDLHFICD